MAKTITIEDLKAMDLEAVQKDIADLEQQRDAIQSQIDGRREILKIVTVLIHGKPPRKKRGEGKPAKIVREESSTVHEPAKTGKRGRPSHSDRILELLKTESLTADQIAKRTDIPRDAVTHVLNNADGIDMHADGRWFRLF